MTPSKFIKKPKKINWFFRFFYSINRTKTGRFEPVSVFFFLKTSLVNFLDENRTEPEMLTPNYYHCFKTWLRGRSGANPGSWVRLRLRVWLIIDPCQRKDEINYYNSLKTRFKSRPDVRLGLWVRLTIDLSQYKDKNNNY
jgi:hypothetical protein